MEPHQTSINKIREEIKIFKEEILTKLFTLEKTKENSDIKSFKFQQFAETKLTDFNRDFEELQDLINELKIENAKDAKMFENLDKLNELIKFKEVSEEDINNINKRLIKISGDLQTNLIRIDKILFNYEVPGFIGEGSNCKYLRLKDYILVLL